MICEEKRQIATYRQRWLCSADTSCCAPVKHLLFFQVLCFVYATSGNMIIIDEYAEPSHPLPAQPGQGSHNPYYAGGW